MEQRQIPGLDKLLNLPQILKLQETFPRAWIKTALQRYLSEVRSDSGRYSAGIFYPDPLAQTIRELISRIYQPSLRRVVNASGTILHTNIGRAPLADEAIEAVAETSRGYLNLEYDLASGDRGHRSDHLNRVLIELTHAEAGFAVNNNAGAVLLALASVAAGREVVVSRGELIEIGGGFRIPEVMALSGAILVEVGTTNRTHVSDYERAITPQTGLLFKAHPSNFGMVGFTKSVEMEELVDLGKKFNLPILYDLGSGCLVDGQPFGWNASRADECIAKGIDLVTFSGDKLLGGPQAGILIGKKYLVEKAAKHPFARALRIDKLSLAALEATLNIYRDPDSAWNRIPVLRMLSTPIMELQRRARRLASRLRSLDLPGITVRSRAADSVVGGGALPLTPLPTWIVEITSTPISPDNILAALRAGTPPIIARIDNDSVVLDLRTILPGEERDILAGFKRVAS
jgi:L-seryl-tRNA(Ser) seleniumtransferase